MNNELKKYKDIFGKPKEGLHKYRLFNIAIVDVLMTLIAAYLFSKILNYNIIYCIIFLFILGIIMHKLFSVDTTINNIIFNSN